MSFLSRLKRRFGSALPEPPEPGRAPDLDPSQVGTAERVGMDGRPLKAQRGGITGLEGGGHKDSGGLPPGGLWGSGR